MPRAFTLIELLIVVAIIAILAAIAVSNFLEAQTRAKVARTRADLRSVATGLEAYRVDFNDYPPNDGVFNVLPIELSTPIAYLTSTNFPDPFNLRELHPVYGELIRYYTYTKIVTLGEVVSLTLAMRPPPVEGIDAPGFNEGAFARYGPWRLVGFGPDRIYSDMASFPPVLYGADLPYDATNGTVSFGNLLRTQMHSVEVYHEGD
jgi:prepilin-type N-terminal cleavage/methylation domain-containing protein